MLKVSFALQLWGEKISLQEMILLVFHEKKEEEKENESMNYHIIHMVHNRVSFYRSLHFVALLL